MKLRILVIGAASLVALTGCVDDGYGYSSVGVGYGAPGYYNDFYDGGYGSPYYGWYGGYYYPGSGYYVYDRYRRPMRWNDGQRRYWEGRGQSWRGQDRRDEWRGFDRGPARAGGDGYRWSGNGNRGGDGGRWRGGGNRGGDGNRSRGNGDGRRHR